MFLYIILICSFFGSAYQNYPTIVACIAPDEFSSSIADNSQSDTT